MQLIYALINVDKSEKNTDSWFSLEDFCRIAGCNEYDVDNTKCYTRLHAYWINCWLCTDTFVGMRAIYLGDRLVGMSIQTSRKSDVDILFIGQYEADLVCTWIRECRIDKNTYEIIEMSELEGDIGSGDTVIFPSQILDKVGTVDGRPCIVIDNSGGYPDYKILVKFTDSSETKSVGISEFTIPYRVNL